MTTIQSKAPAIIQTWNDGSIVELLPNAASIYPETLSTGIVIGTYAAVPYIHLQLEARRRFYPNVPLLVHDDGSHKTAELQDLCRQYGCDFEHNRQRQSPSLGDLSAFVGGLLWATNRHVDVLLKVSRRWLFQTNWEPSLRALATQSQYATFGSYTTSFGFGFRTECVGMAVAIWGTDNFLDATSRNIVHGRSVFVEGYVHHFARGFEVNNCQLAEQWREAHPMPDDRRGYALWILLGTDRCERSPHFLWHDSCGPKEYLEVASKWGLRYTLEDFTDPNQGAGSEQ